MSPVESSPRPQSQALSARVSQSYSYDTNNGDDDDRSKANALWDMIDDEEWETVIELISDFPQLARSRNRVPNSIQFNRPLHEVCRRQPPLQVVNLLLTFYDEAVHTPGQYGFLPLHVACGTGASYEVVTRLIDAYPAATRCRDDVKDVLPLHLAAQWGASEEVLMEILTTHPEGSFIRDASGKTPLDHAKALPESEAKQYAISALATAPVLVAAAKSAAVRVEREMESRIRGVQVAHQEFIRQLEQRHEDEKTEFLQLEVQFHNELATEKERNCELAEVIVRLQKREWGEAEGRDALKQRLEEQQTEFKARWEQQQKGIRSILEKVDSSHLKSREISPGRQEGGDDQKNEDAEVDGSPVIKQISSAISESSTISSSSALLDKLSQVVGHYNETEKQLKKVTEELHSNEAMVQQLNDTVHKKGLEIQSLTSQLQNERSKNQSANTDLGKMGVLHKEAVQELYSFKNEMNRLKRRSENQQQQLQETRRKLELRERRMEKVKGLIASLSLNVDKWDLGPEESQWRDMKDTGGRQGADGLQGAKESIYKMKKSSSKTKIEIVSEADPNIVDDMEKIQNISNISMDKNEGSAWGHKKNQEQAVHVSYDEGDDEDNLGLEVSVLKTGEIFDKPSEDSNETAMTTQVADDEVDGEDGENMSFLSQHSSPGHGIESIRPID